MKYVGERKLSWFEVAKIIGYVLRRNLFSKFQKQPYLFGETLPRKAIDDALEQAVKHNMRMPIERKIPFEIEAVKDAIELVASHRAKGRIVIEFAG